LEIVGRPTTGISDGRGEGFIRVETRDPGKLIDRIFPEKRFLHNPNRGKHKNTFRVKFGRGKNGEEVDYMLPVWYRKAARRRRRRR
jgi:hypothetical protein